MVKEISKVKGKDLVECGGKMKGERFVGTRKFHTFEAYIYG